MTEATQTATPNDAREASKSRVQTQETILAKLIPQEAAKVHPEGGNAQGEPNKEGEAKPKKGPHERIQELAAKRREAEAKAEVAERKAADLEARMLAMQAQAKPLEQDARPVRAAFVTDEDYTDAVAGWKAKRMIAEREQEQAKARYDAEQAEIDAQWSKRQEAVMKDLPDYAEVIGKSDISVPNYVVEAIRESEQGPQITYYLALHPDEAKRLSVMKPVAGIKRIAALERDLADIEVEEKAQESKEKAPPQVQKSKAPPPIDTIKSVPSSSGGSSNDFEEYKRRREAEKRK